MHIDNPLLGPLSRAEFITANMPLVHKAAQRYRGRCSATHTPLDDVISEGYIGLIYAYDHYDNTEAAFGTYAHKCIDGYMRNFFRQPIGPVRIPHDITPLVNRLARAGLSDSPAEVVASELGISVKLAVKALYCDRIRRGAEMPERERTGSRDDYTYVYTDAFLARLKPRPARIMRLLMAEYTQSEAAQEVGISRQAVSQTVRRVQAEYEAWEGRGSAEKVCA